MISPHYKKNMEGGSPLLRIPASSIKAFFMKASLLKAFKGNSSCGFPDSNSCSWDWTEPAATEGGARNRLP